MTTTELTKERDQTIARIIAREESINFHRIALANEKILKKQDERTLWLLQEMIDQQNGSDTEGHPVKGVNETLQP